MEAVTTATTQFGTFTVSPVTNEAGAVRSVLPARFSSQSEPSNGSIVRDELNSISDVVPEDFEEIQSRAW